MIIFGKFKKKKKEGFFFPRDICKEFVLECTEMNKTLKISLLLLTRILFWCSLTFFLIALCSLTNC